MATNNPLPIVNDDYNGRLHVCTDTQLADWLRFVGTPICREAARRIETQAEANAGKKVNP